MGKSETFEAVGTTVDEALAKAQKLAEKQVGPRPGSDIVMTHVVEWGAQFGGFTQARSFWVKVEVDETSPFKT